MFLTELFNTTSHPFNVINSSEDELRITSTIGDELITFVSTYDRYGVPIRVDNNNNHVERVSVDGYEIYFGANKITSSKIPDYHLTHTGQAFKVFPFIIQCMKAAIKHAENHGMPAFHFSADMLEPSRVALYHRLMKMLPPSYATFEKSNPAYVHYHAIKKDYLEFAMASNKEDAPIRLGRGMPPQQAANL